MSLIDRLKLQDIEDDIEVSVSNTQSDGDISLVEPVDETKLEVFWDEVIQDVHKDPTWVDFNKK